jgi:hypothetical protein
LHCRRKAAASKWTKSRPSGPSSSSCLLFCSPKTGAKNRPQKRERNIAGRRKGFQNGGPVSGTRVLQAMGLRKPHPSFTVYIIYIYVYIYILWCIIYMVYI